ncbi:hypothetical protein [Stenotrophomonas maltophilia group sp. RNC7]|uniref:hypothetical protein n=1 Tax=Stenotrophomonas maltophilia group sp. RNC7 TaxID=3071467 RepID=UPI0027E0902E|nr:hypothetical protein [Stenotrophomonas maltophilia group sp. RNC7]MDQ4679846.1 hypothetical protein [Stenotrophomonas maltophilia group sp. RNC7]
MEELIKKKRDLECAVISIEFELMELSKGLNDNDADEYIANVALKRPNVDQVKINTKGHITDKTGSTAVNFRENLEKEIAETIDQLKYELYLFKIVIEKLDIAFRVISEEGKKIIELKYIENLTWFEIEDNLLITKNKGQDIRKKSIERLRSISRITAQQYKQVIEILDLK